MHIHSLLQDMAERGETPFILQIGAMDGISGPDPLHEFLSAYDWPALLVEPVPWHHETLEQTYAARPLVRTAQCAIAAHTGTAILHVVDRNAENLPRWAPEASSLYRDRTVLHWQEISPYVREIEVPCMTLPDLLAAHKAERIDVLQVDAEGHDYQILCQLDFSRYQPAVINLEIVNLPAAEQAACLALLDGHGYRCRKTGYDLVAHRS